MVFLNTKPNHSRNFISDVEDIRRTEKYEKKLILIGACIRNHLHPQLVIAISQEIYCYGSPWIR